MMSLRTACLTCISLLALALAVGTSTSAQALDSPAASDTARTARTASAPRWALVLSGGGARGLAEIGVLRVLDQEGVRPDLVVGTSMGAIVGALYASGLSADQIAECACRVGWGSLFNPNAGPAYEWRGTWTPAPWLKLASRGRGFRLPSALLDESALDLWLALELAEADMIAQGDFDRLPIPLRVVATDMATLSPVVLRHGSIARAVRISSSIPFVLPLVMDDGRLLVDGGMASNLPVGTARAEGVDHIFAVDVALPQPELTEESSALTLVFALLDRVNLRGRTDTLSVSDRRIRLRLPGFSATDFARADSLIAVAERESRAPVRAMIEAWGLARAKPLAAQRDTLPPLRGEPRWLEGSGAPSRRGGKACARFGQAPAGLLTAHALEPGLLRVFRGDLFESAWPAFRVAGDSTDMTVQVRDQDPAQLGLAFAYDSDEFARANLTFTARPVHTGWPGFMRTGLTVRTYGAQLYGSAEPHALHRGASGWFLRGTLRRTDTRRFAGDQELGRVRTDRIEVMAGRQLALSTGDVVQAGVGFGRAHVPGATQSGVIGALYTESAGRLVRRLRGTVLGGPAGYGTMEARLACDLPVGPVHARPAVTAAWASRRTPPDELCGVGGSESFVGLQPGEWLGRSLVWGELRLTRSLTSMLEVHAMGQAARVRQASSRADLADRVRFAGGFGVRANVPLGPLSFDWGVTESGVRRIEFTVGQRF